MKKKNKYTKEDIHKSYFVLVYWGQQVNPKEPTFTLFGLNSDWPSRKYMFEIADQLCSPVGRPFRHIKGSEIEHDYIIDYFLGILNNDEFENPRESWEEFYFEDVKADNDLNALFLKNVSNIKKFNSTDVPWDSYTAIQDRDQKEYKADPVGFAKKINAFDLSISF